MMQYLHPQPKSQPSINLLQLAAKSKSNHDIANLHPLSMSLQNINFLHFTISYVIIKPGQDLKTQGHYGKVEGQIRVTSCCYIPMLPNKFPIRYQLPTPYSP